MMEKFRELNDEVGPPPIDSWVYFNYIDKQNIWWIWGCRFTNIPIDWCFLDISIKPAEIGGVNTVLPICNWPVEYILQIGNYLHDRWQPRLIIQLAICPSYPSVAVTPATSEIVSNVLPIHSWWWWWPIDSSGDLWNSASIIIPSFTLDQAGREATRRDDWVPGNSRLAM